MKKIDLSVVIPAFNEEKRLPFTLVDTLDFLEKQRYLFEIIIVDDGSFDGTCEVVNRFVRMGKPVNLISYKPNQGKGNAVKTGALAAVGNQILLADADGATPIAELKRLEMAIQNGADIAIGSRAVKSEETKIETAWYRRFLGQAFNRVVNLIAVPGIRDTQCGFKLFTNSAARFLFSKQRSNGFSFDVEILYLAQKSGMQIAEVPINWHNVPGSKVNLVADSIRMFRDVCRFKAWHPNVPRFDYANN